MTYSNISKISLSLLGFALFLFGCNRPVQELHFIADASIKDALQHRLDEFSTQYPPVTIKVTWCRDMQELQDTIKTASGNNTLPDLWITRDESLPGLVKNQLIQEVPPELIQQRFIPELMQGSKVGGKIYGLPFSWDTTVMFYNKTIFSKHLIPQPAQYWDWSDFAVTAEALTIEGNDGSEPVCWGLDSSSKPEQWLPMLFQENGSIQNEKRHWVLTDPQYVQSNAEAIRYYADLVRMFSSAVNPANSSKAFIQGRASMIIADRGFIDQLKGVNFDWNISPLPHERLDASLVKTDCIVIKRETPHGKEAILLAQFLTSDISQTALALSGLSPTLTGLPSSRAFLEYPGNHAVKNQYFVDALSHAQWMPRHIDPKQVRSILQEEMQNLINDPDRNERDALDAMQARLEELDLAERKPK